MADLLENVSQVKGLHASLPAMKALSWLAAQRLLVFKANGAFHRQYASQSLQRHLVEVELVPLVKPQLIVLHSQPQQTDIFKVFAVQVTLVNPVDSLVSKDICSKV